VVAKGESCAFDGNTHNTLNRNILNRAQRQ